MGSSEEELEGSSGVGEGLAGEGGELGLKGRVGLDQVERATAGAGGLG